MNLTGKELEIDIRQRARGAEIFGHSASTDRGLRHPYITPEGWKSKLFPPTS
jgi:hypothetical protein